MEIGIIGAGAFGTSLGHIFATYSNKSHNVVLYSFEEDVASDINTNHLNTKYFPNNLINKKVVAASSLKEALENKDLILYVSPVKFTASLSKEFSKYNVKAPIIICSKGIDVENGLLVSEILSKNLKNAQIGVLAGPCFASESYKGLPTALVLALEDVTKANKIIKDLDLTTLRLYSSKDIIGTQIGGAVKNIIAIAAGVTAGLNLGQNALASLITRSLNELKEVCLKMNGLKETVMGLSGLGDLVLTASSNDSRNFSLGLEIGKNNGYSDGLKPQKQGIAEGYYSAKSIFEISKKYNIDLPICLEVYNILYQNKKPVEAINNLLNRETKEEF